MRSRLSDGYGPSVIAETTSNDSRGLCPEIHTPVGVTATVVGSATRELPVSGFSRRQDPVAQIAG